uniref:NADH-ubiquinone oxidoreductase chain 2 n=3 Tax=Champsocephalus TaxID=52236 RepID=Q7Y7A6_CHAGU|nr:NADH dehydrogenase subunit 2 [Champsocephalus gunnari]AAP13033.1 NADH dehydrogenase subunit 2 [Champsocephalus esox]AAP13034.1 NADH dehydrogenase subunit 2 [Champsocephalus gunnari]AAP13035.1 NADH dehydrogenase subunit 2 [Champsocephalus gunnari]ADW15934.1 NADH dehydrogenase subunit 2 [Champsocephalus gunnari]AEO15859.1 NADH dehydrogenase subunit 2 [Champsocephalus gunnari]
MSPYVLALLLFSLGLGTTMTFASSHWLLAWIGLEINTLAIIPLMAQNHHPRAVEATTKYFLIQATAAAVLLFAGTTNAWLTGQWEIQQDAHPLPVAIITLALALKLGLAPLHSWVPEVFQGLDLTTGLVLATWQKLAPLALLLQIHPPNSYLLILLGLTSTLIGGWGGLNQTQLRKILAYSSTAQLGWMVLVLQFSPSLTTLAVSVYVTTTAATFLTLKLAKATSINMLAISWAKAPALVALTPLVLLSLAGLPPMTGFMPKWLILQELSKQGLAPTATLAALTALLSLYYYLRITYTMTLTMFPNNLSGTPPWRLRTHKTTLPLACLAITTISLLPLTPAAVALVAL